MDHLSGIVSRFEGLRVLVVGDMMLDRFVYGDVDRISPESPVPVLKVVREVQMLGGGGNVASNLAALGMLPLLISIAGDDDNARRVEGIAKDIGCDTDIVRDASRPTIVKTRYIARNQQLMRSDREEIHAMDAAVEENVMARVERALKAGGVGAVVLSDYGKGVLNATVTSFIIKMANAIKIPVLVDPKGRDYARYAGADVVTPNRKELAEAAGAAKLSSDADITDAGRRVISAADIRAIVATRSEDGLSVIRYNGETAHFKTRVREVFDVSGAGDTVIAVIAGGIAGGASLEDSAALANIAAGIAVGKVGTTSVTAAELLASLHAKLSPGALKICTPEYALARVRGWKDRGLKVGFTNGCFDIIHKGHVAYMEEARGRCDRLIVALNSDASVKILKGPSRPINDQHARAAVMAGLASIDAVVFFGADKAGEDNTPCALIEYLKPDIFFKGGDYTIDTLPEAKIVHAYGGEVELMPFHHGFSTTSIIEKSRAR